MDKSKVNLIINVLMFFCVMAVTGIGLLMKYVLLPGRETLAMYGRKVDLFFLGKDRHEWGMIHLIIAFVFLGLMTLHIVLHWKTMWISYRRFIGNKVLRFALVVIVAVAGVFLVAFPLVVNPELRKSERKGSHQRENDKEKDTKKATW
ncbi:MAG: hypothetical protein HW390_2074 [Candidatus Brocadiaceae bacterium]|nr:hypothetical protein [Candidatus Brocadiaceae bacterium]